MNMLHVCAFDVNSLDNFLKVACIKLTLLSNRGLLVNDLFDVALYARSRVVNRTELFA
jgi:hypothetical protein